MSYSPKLSVTVYCLHISCKKVFCFQRQIVVLSFNLLQRACTLSQERSLSIQFAHQGKSPLGCVTLNTSSCANFEPSLAAGAPFARLKLNLRKHSSVVDDLPPQRDVDKNDTCLILGLVDRLQYISRILSISLFCLLRMLSISIKGSASFHEECLSQYWINTNLTFKT